MYVQLDKAHQSPSLFSIEGFSATMQSAAKKVNSLYQGAREVLIVAHDSIDYAKHWGNEFFDRRKGKIFKKEEIVVETRNMGKFSDIPRYARLESHPHPIDSATVETINRQGFVKMPSDAEVRTTPFGLGKCRGATTLLARDLLKGEITESHIESCAQQFKGGVPFDAALHQSVICATRQCFSGNGSLFEMLMTADYEKEFLEHKKTLIEFYSQQPPDLGYNEQSMHVLEGVHDFFNTKKKQDPKLKDAKLKDLLVYLRSSPFEALHTHVKEFVEERYHENIEEADLFAMRQFHVESSSLSFTSQVSLAIEGLEVESEEIKSEQGTACSVINKLDGLAPGVYECSFPLYYSNGLLHGRHVVAFAKTEDKFYIYDSNCAFARLEDPKRTLTNLFKSYHNYSGHELTWKERVRNTFMGRKYKATPTPTGFILNKIKKQQL